MNDTKLLALGIVLGGVLVGGSILFSALKTNGGGDTPAKDNISIVDGKQIIEIGVKGGYSPRQMIAKANMPTTLKMKTNGTFDCSSALSIPALGYRSYLPATGETAIDVPPQQVGAVLRGTCAMGMYSFAVTFN